MVPRNSRKGENKGGDSEWDGKEKLNNVMCLTCEIMC